MTDIAQARLEKAREIAASVYNTDGVKADFMTGAADKGTVVQSTLAALNLADWQPPEDPDIAICRRIWDAHGVTQEPSKDAVIAAFKAGKAAA